MPCDLVLGGQWGDEGKGKIVDAFAAGAHAVVRYQGGANAGHTLVIDGRKVALHLIPSGVRHPDCLLVLGGGMVVDPLALEEEIASLEAAGFDLRRRLRVGRTAHAVLPCHRLQDQAEERSRGGGAVGTTGRGIGPAYADKAARTGLQLGVFELPAGELRDTLGAFLERKRAHHGLDFDVAAMCASLLALRERLRPLLCDASALVQDLVTDGRRVLLEGAQGTMLDLDHGSYPFVTSSACTSAGALAGSGLPPQAVASVTGVFKAYATRVGNGPFPTELDDATGERLRRIGHEYGATTGRPRRCGWFDAVAARHAARLNGFTQIVVTKLDVLDTFESIRVADWYDVDGERSERFPADPRRLMRCTPGWIEVEGWRSRTADCRRWADLPVAAQRFLDLLRERTGVPIGHVSVGPEHDALFPVATS